ncbi:hypothetical protein Ct61P_00265 [Colletotrichum tofieldiae]|nr:hypothetical protein Ct61P_00265 [Colletotrichum tofieldiae]
MSLICTASVSSLKYWDPANLLQIVGQGRHDEIRCVGRAMRQGGARCRWTVDHERQIQIEANLERMANRHPADITTEELRDLAELCLCRDWHSYQQEDTVHHWRGVVLRAAENLRTVKAELSREQKDGITKLQAELRAKEADLQRSREQYRSLERKSDSTRCAQAKQFESQESELLKIRQQLKSATENVKRLKMSILDHHRKLEQTTTDLIDKTVRRITTLEDEKKELEASVDASRTRDGLLMKRLVRETEEKRRLLSKNGVLREMLKGYQSREENQIHRETPTEGELSAQKSAKEARFTAEALRLQNLKSKLQVEFLGRKVARLEADIAACWLHRIRSHMRGVLLGVADTVFGYNLWFVRLIESIAMRKRSLIKRT